MGYYTQQEFDFVQRTKKILEQYDSIDFSKNESEKYEITLLLNCFVGLLILPKEHWYDKLPKTEIDEEVDEYLTEFKTFLYDEMEEEE